MDWPTGRPSALPISLEPFMVSLAAHLEWPCLPYTLLNDIDFGSSFYWKFVFREGNIKDVLLVQVCRLPSIQLNMRTILNII